MNLILAMIQGLILDLTYTNDQLKRFISLAAVIVQREINFNTTYTVDVINNTISPDPTDNDFCLFVASYAALIIIKSELKTVTSQSIKVVDGPSSIDLTQYSKNLTEYYKLLQEEFDKAKISYIVSGKIDTTGYAVMTPTTYEG